MKKSLYVLSGSAKTAMRHRRADVAYRMAYWKQVARRFRVEHLQYVSLNDSRARIVMAIFTLAFTIALGRAYYLATDPFLRQQAALIAVNTELSSVSALERQSRKLSELTVRVEAISIGELRTLLIETAKIARGAAVDFQTQYEAWSSMRGMIKQDSSTYDALRSQLAEAKKMEQEEILYLKKMLEAAQQPSIFSDVVNLTISFVFGIVSSLVASAMYERWSHRRRSAA
jgi:hypothetical protein